MMDVSAVVRNAYWPINVTESGMDIDASEVAALNASLPIYSRELGRVSVVSPVP